MKTGNRSFPAGVVVKHPVNLRRYLPYRIHLLATKIASAPTVTLDNGVVIRARDWRVIACLGSFGPLTNREIADVVGMDAASITRAVQYLVESGLVATQASKIDRRRQLISLTKDGAAAHDFIAPTRSHFVSSIEVFLSENERDTLFHLLDKIEEGFEKTQSNDDDEWSE
jgi:DNA-binding MarR family transcriptional regulator